MVLPEKSQFMQSASQALEELYDVLADLPSVSLSEFDPSRTVLLLVDLVKGFLSEGPLSDPAIQEIARPVRNLTEVCRDAGIAAAAFVDCHCSDAAEFSAFPPHCIEGTPEAELIPELAGLSLPCYPKNSTNGFFCPDFQRDLIQHPQVRTFLVVGDCTDICVMQFCLTLKTYFNQKNQESRVVVPMEAVDTFHAPGHHRDYMNTAALKFLLGAGIEVVSEIDL